jgi:hypothetical protein
MLLTRSLPKIDQYDAEVRYSLQYSNVINNWSSMLSLPGRPVLSFVFERARTTSVRKAKSLWMHATQAFEFFRFEVLYLFVGHRCQ